MLFGCCIKNVEDIPKVQEAGYDFYEFSGAVLARFSEEEFEDMCCLSRRLEFPCLGFNSYSSGRPAIIGWDYSPQAVADYAQLLCHRGHALGIHNIGIGSPKARCRPENMGISTAHEQCADFLRLTSREAAKYNISILLEAVHSGACNYLNYTWEAVNMAKSLDIPTLGLVLDFYHMSMMSENFDQARLAEPWIKHVHFSTAGENDYRGFPQEAQREEYRSIFALLRDLDYTGSISIEPSDFDREQASSCLKLLRELSF